MVLGALNFSAFAFQTYGLVYTLSSIVAFITGLYVIFVPILSYFIFKKSVSVYSAIGTVLALWGIYLLTGESTLGFGMGEVLTLFCAILFSLHLIYTDTYSKLYDINTLVVVQFLTISVASLIFAAINKDVLIPNIDTNFVLAIITTVLFATVFAFYVQTSMQRYTTPTKTALIFIIEPVSAAFFGYYMADEALNKTQILGAFIVICGVLYSEIMNYKKR